jgi:HK97 gp10 family phage protein
MAEAIEIEGMKELNRELRRLEVNMRKNIVKSGLRAAGAVVRKKARSNLSGEYSRFKKTIQVKLLKPKSKFTITALVGGGVHKGRNRKTGKVSSTDFWFAHIVELGTLGSRVAPLAPRTRRKPHTQPLPHGLRSRPFLRPAFDSSKTTMVRAFGDKVWARIRKEHTKR